MRANTLTATYPLYGQYCNTVAKLFVDYSEYPMPLDDDYCIEIYLIDFGFSGVTDKELKNSIF